MSIKGEQLHLLTVLAENGGRLSNQKALEELSEKAKRGIDREEYEHIKEQLLSQGKITKSPGRGGCIKLTPVADQEQINVSDKSRSESEEAEGESDMVEQLMTSLAPVPGARAKQNKRTITLLCGDDNDKLFCGWDTSKQSFYIQYRLEPGRSDCSDLAESLFRQATADMTSASVTRNSASVTTYIGSNVAQCNRAIKRLMSRLEDVTLDNAPKSINEPTKPRSERYYHEIGKLIKICVDNDLRWPLKNWRKSLGFDDVDDLIVIGYSDEGRRSPTPYREHVVPACLIKEEAIKIAERGASAEEISRFIRHHLHVVIISPAEAQRLNSSQDAGGISLKTTMPEGWIFGDDPTQRLTDAGIKIGYERHSIPQWKPWKSSKWAKVKGFLFMRLW